MRGSRLRTYSAAMVLSWFALTPPLTLAKQDEAKAKPKTHTKGNSGRQAGELPSGLQKQTENKGQLPIGLQKMEDKDAQLAKGLETEERKFEATKAISRSSKDFR